MRRFIAGWQMRPARWRFTARVSATTSPRRVPVTGRSGSTWSIGTQSWPPLSFNRPNWAARREQFSASLSAQRWGSRSGHHHSPPAGR